MVIRNILITLNSILFRYPVSVYKDMQMQNQTSTKQTIT